MHSTNIGIQIDGITFNNTERIQYVSGDSAFWSQIIYLQLNARILRDTLPYVE
jgi:hypothetical protein